MDVDVDVDVAMDDEMESWRRLRRPRMERDRESRAHQASPMRHANAIRSRLRQKTKAR